jgi:hypothetical protein
VGRHGLRELGCTIGFVVVAGALYVGIYLLLADPSTEIWVGMRQREARYRYGGDTSRAAFAPLEAADRALFPDRWWTPFSMMTLPDVVAMAQEKFPDATIIRQFERSHSNFELSTYSITYLREQGVSEAVIAAMQIHREQPLVHRRW